MGGGLAGRCPTLKATVEGAIANHLQERFVANCSELKDRHSEPRHRHCERSEAIHSATQRIVIPAKAGIQYAAAYRFNHCCLWDTGSPAFAGDDG